MRAPCVPGPSSTISTVSSNNGKQHLLDPGRRARHRRSRRPAHHVGCRAGRRLWPAGLPRAAGLLESLPSHAAPGPPVPPDVDAVVVRALCCVAALLAEGRARAATQVRKGPPVRLGLLGCVRRCAVASPPSLLLTHSTSCAGHRFKLYRAAAPHPGCATRNWAPPPPPHTHACTHAHTPSRALAPPVAVVIAHTVTARARYRAVTASCASGCSRR